MATLVDCTYSREAGDTLCHTLFARAHATRHTTHHDVDDRGDEEQRDRHGRPLPNVEDTAADIPPSIAR